MDRYVFHFQEPYINCSLFLHLHSSHSETKTVYMVWCPVVMLYCKKVGIWFQLKWSILGNSTPRINEPLWTPGRNLKLLLVPTGRAHGGLCRRDCYHSSKWTTVHCLPGLKPLFVPVVSLLTVFSLIITDGALGNVDLYLCNVWFFSVTLQDVSFQIWWFPKKCEMSPGTREERRRKENLFALQLCIESIVLASYVQGPGSILGIPR